MTSSPEHKTNVESEGAASLTKIASQTTKAIKSEKSATYSPPAIQTQVTRVTAIFSLVLITTLIIGVLLLGYMGKTWTEIISFRVDDGWCKTGFEGIGKHCFGDFGLGYYRGYQPSVYLTGNYAAANTPITAVLFELLRLLPYNIALSLYLGGAVVSLAYPIVAETRGLHLEVRGLIVLAISICGAGSISALDRGNHVAYLVPLLYLYLVSVEQKKWGKATLLLVGLAILKFWGIIFVVSLLLNRKFWESVKAVFFTISISAVALAFFPGGFIEKLHVMSAMVTNRDYSNSIAGYAMSFFGLARRTGCFFANQSWCNTKTYTGTFWTSTTALALITLIALLIVVVLHFVSSKHRLISTLLVSVFGLVLVPDAPRYNSVFLIVLIALVLRNQGANTCNGSSWTSREIVPWILVVSTGVALIPLTLGTHSLNRFSTGTGDSPLIARLDFWLVPLLFAFAFAASGASAILDWLRRDDQDREPKRNSDSSSERDVYCEDP